MAEDKATQALAARNVPGLDKIAPEREQVYLLLYGSMMGEVDLLDSWDTEEVQKALALGILGSETMEEVFGDQGLRPWSEMLGVPVEIRDVHFNPSQIEGGPGFYAVVQLADLQTGEVSMRHIGGWRPTSQLLFAWGRGTLPYRCKVVEVGKAKPGQNAPLGIVSLATPDKEAEA